MSALEAGLATLPAAAGMIAITPAITPLAGKIGGGRAVGARLRSGDRRLRGAGVRRGVVGVRGVRGPAGRARGRPRHRQRAGVVGLDRGGVARAGRRGVRDLEHGALRRRRRRRGRDRDDRQRGRQQPPRGRRVRLATRWRPASSSSALADGDLVRRRHPARSCSCGVSRSGRTRAVDRAAAAAASLHTIPTDQRLRPPETSLRWP